MARSTPRAGSGAVASALLAWFDAHRRPLPWRASRDPYRIWLAEVLLQQTRVAQATPYFERFVSAYPTVDALAAADPDAVMKLWEGAGYYARARRLHATAREIAGPRHGVWPTTVEGLRALPGIGPYTAAAVASLAFGAPAVAFEANGLRVAARWTLERGDVRRSEVRARLVDALAAQLPNDRSGAFNEALMELGETVCRPASPNCPECPVARHCRAQRELDDPGSLPVRRRTPPKPWVRAAVVGIRRGERWLVQRRPLTGLLPGLWEFPGGKIEDGETPTAAAIREVSEETGLRLARVRPAGVVRHAYSHFGVELHVFRAAAPPATPPRSTDARRWVTAAEFARLAQPRATAKAWALLRAGTGSG